MASIPRDGIELDLERLDVGIRQLKVQYDMFFAGALPRPPLEKRTEIERIVRRQAQQPNVKYAQRFRLNSLVSRFNSLCELWGKTTRSMEQGSQRHAGLLDQFQIRERLLARCQVGEQQTEADLRRIHNRYVEASRHHGGRAPSYEKFAQGVSAQTRRLRDEAGCGEIELRLVVRDDKVQLKARPAR